MECDATRGQGHDSSCDPYPVAVVAVVVMTGVITFLDHLGGY